MKIVHVAPNTVYNDGWSYQDNLLPKYQVKCGHDVTLITNTREHVGNETIKTAATEFESCDGFKVVRIDFNNYRHRFLTDLFSKLDLYEKLLEIQPDAIFYHGLESTTIFDVIKYKKQALKNGVDVKIVQDNHADYNIGHKTTSFAQKVLREYYRILNCYSQKYVEHIYGVTPWRKEYAEKYYRISPRKTGVLLMGADDEKIDFANKKSIRENLRRQYNIPEDKFLIVTGGRIDNNKKIHTLMDACGDMPGVTLLVFGSVAKSFQKEYDKRVDKYNNIVSAGWVISDKVYNYFLAADLVCFPGQHSVLWEQACASKVPCVFSRWPGMEHINNGGNSIFFDEINPESIRKTISKLVFTPQYKTLKNIAESEVTDIYLYSKIAEKSLEYCKYKSQ